MWSASRRAATSLLTSGLQVPDRVNHMAVRRVPLRRGSVELPDVIRIGSAQLEAQQVGEQVVIAKPQPVSVECNDERVRLLQQYPSPLA